MLSATVVIDYQNLNLVGGNLFLEKSNVINSYIHPTKFAELLIKLRNSKILNKEITCLVTKILVYRGLPSPEYDPLLNSRSKSQASRWKLDARTEIVQRPLRYSFSKNKRDEFLLDANGKRIVIKREEKGIDVLCALALVREARTSDLVILASQDTDLVPAIEEAVALKQAKIETFSWYSKSSRRSFELRSPVAPTWNTRLGEEEYFQCLDENIYGV